jgi:hypothetical protein
MNENPQVAQQTDEPDSTPAPNEQGGFIFSTSIKITDPDTKEILLHMRGDD